MLSLIKKYVNLILGIIGLEVGRVKSNTPLDRLNKALQHFGIDTVLDVGANTGQFSSELLHRGFRGRIISFEPLTDAYVKLGHKSKKYDNWLIHPRGALGDKDGEATINVAGNSVSSSILDMNSAHSDAAEGSAYIRSEAIKIQKLDSIASLYLSDNNKTFLKIDTQGFESQVLDGAIDTLPYIRGILLEVSLVELYNGQVLWRDMIARLEAEGFTIWSIETGFSDPRDGRTLQCDIAFFRI